MDDELVAEILNDDEIEVEKTSTGVNISSEITRGTGTRDQERHKIKAKGEDFDDAREKHRKGVEYVEEEVLERTREWDPERGENG